MIRVEAGEVEERFGIGGILFDDLLIELGGFFPRPLFFIQGGQMGQRHRIIRLFREALFQKRGHIGVRL